MEPLMRRHQWLLPRASVIRTKKNKLNLEKFIIKIKDFHTTTHGCALVIRSLLGTPRVEVVVKSKYLPRMWGDNNVTVLHVDPPRLIPIQKMDCGRRRPMRDSEVVEDDSIREVNSPELVRVGHYRRIWQQSLRELRLPQTRRSV